MFKGGRNKDPVLTSFISVEVNEKISAAKCRKCGKQQRAKPCRIRAHLEKCVGNNSSDNQEVTSNTTVSEASVSLKRSLPTEFDFRDTQVSSPVK